MPRSQLFAAASEFGKNPPYQAASEGHGWGGRWCRLTSRAMVRGKQRRQWRQKIFDAERNCGRRFAQGQETETLVFERPPECFVFASVLCKSRQACHRGRVKIAEKKRNQLVANPRAHAGSVLVGGVFPPGLF